MGEQVPEFAVVEFVLDVEVNFSQAEPVRKPNRIEILRISSEFGFSPVDVMGYAKKMISSGVVQ